MKKEELIRFQSEWKNSALEMMSIYEDFHHDHFSRMEFARWVIAQGKEAFDNAFNNRSHCIELYAKYETDTSSLWDCSTLNEDIDGTPPEYLSQIVFELEYDEELSDIVDDRINDSSFYRLIEKYRQTEKFFEYPQLH